MVDLLVKDYIYLNLFLIFIYKIHNSFVYLKVFITKVLSYFLKTFLINFIFKVFIVVLINFNLVNVLFVQVLASNVTWVFMDCNCDNLEHILFLLVLNFYNNYLIYLFLIYINLPLVNIFLNKVVKNQVVNIVYNVKIFYLVVLIINLVELIVIVILSYPFYVLNVDLTVLTLIYNFNNYHFEIFSFFYSSWVYGLSWTY